MTRRREPSIGGETPPVRPRRGFELAYTIGVVLKGIDGLVELVTGVLLIMSPGMVHLVLSATIAEARESNAAVRVFIADHLAHLNAQLTSTAIALLVVFLLVHGVVKLVLVYCLLRRLHRVYPYALAILVLFLAFQVYAFVRVPSVSLAIFTVIDVVIIVLVWLEWRKLRGRAVAAG